MEHIEYLKMIGKKGGQTKTEKKAESSRKNGKKGGRPKVKRVV